MVSSGTNTELTVRINNELSALILRQTLLLDGCVFACEKSCIQAEFINWLDTLAYHTKIDYIRKEKKHTMTDSIDEMQEDRLLIEDTEQAFALDHIWGFDFFVEWLEKAFLELSEVSKKILYLHVVEEKPLTEISDVIGYSYPRIVKPQIQAYDDDEVRIFFNGLKEESPQIRALLMTSLLMGLRRGEAVGLMWSDINFKAGSMYISRSAYKTKGQPQALKPPKSQSSVRTVFFSEAYAEVLLAWREEQVEQRIKAGRSWNEQVFVFTNEFGNMSIMN